MNNLRFVKRAVPLVAAALVMGCGGSDDGDGSGNTTTPPDPNLGYVIGGSASGLAAGKNLVLQNNGGDDLRVLENGKFAFKKVVANGGSYAVTVLTQPEGQTCTVSNGSGKVSADVSNVAVACVTAPVKPVDPNPNPNPNPGDGGDMASCIDNVNYRKAGATYTITTGANWQKSTVMGPATYRGNSAYRTQNVNSAGFEADSYSNMLDNIAYTYGSVMTKPQLHETYFSPAMAMPLSLPVNQTYTQSLNQITVQAGAADYVMPVVMTTTYRGRETVTTAFGTFETCKIDFTAKGSEPPLTSRTHWYVASGKLAGFAVQSNSSDGLTQPTKIEVSWN